MLPSYPNQNPNSSPYALHRLHDPHSSSPIKQQSDVEALLLQQTFKNTRLSDLLFDKSKSTTLHQPFSHQPPSHLLQQLSLLKQLLLQKDQEIFHLKSLQQPSNLYKQIQFLNLNNHNLFKTLRGFQKQIRKMTREISQKMENQRRLMKEIEGLNLEVAASNKLVRKLLKNQKRVLEGEEEEVSKIHWIKEKFEKENRVLRSRIKGIEKEQAEGKTSRSKHSLSISELNGSRQCGENREIEVMKREISKLKYKVKEIGRQKENSMYQQTS